MSEPCCVAITREGRPCAARPLPGRECCLFHDPDHREAQTESRRQGGSAPRRRIRRFPRVLDHRHVAELLGEVLIDALNDPTAFDPARLRALTHLARLLLRTVGVPKDCPIVHLDRAEPSAAEDHLLRIYPPNPTELDPPSTGMRES